MTQRLGAGPPRCVLIAGPNGAGKTTFARQFLPREGRIVRFVNAGPDRRGNVTAQTRACRYRSGSAGAGGIGSLAAARADFAFESTLAGTTYLARLQAWKAAGYRIEMIFLRLASPQLALRRVAERVKTGGHSVPKADVLRRFQRSLDNFERRYKPLADSWELYDSSGDKHVLLEIGP